MPANLLDDVDVATVVAVITAGTLIKAWISLRMARLHEKSMTDRFTKALEGSSPQQRPAIIRAMGGVAQQTGDDVTAEEVADDTSDVRQERSIFTLLARLVRRPPSAGG